jgi:hypothetical protein
MMTVHGARYITPRATASEGAGKSRSLRNGSARSSSNCNKMVLLPASRRANKKVDPEVDKDKHIEFQNAKRALKVIYGHSDSDSSTDEL